MSSDWFTSESHLRDVEGSIGAGNRSGADADETLQMVRTIRRLRIGIRRLVAYEGAASKWFFQHDAAGLRELEDLANNQVRPERLDQAYFSWLLQELAGLTEEEWEDVKRKRGR